MAKRQATWGVVGRSTTKLKFLDVYGDIRSSPGGEGDTHSKKKQQKGQGEGLEKRNAYPHPAYLSHIMPHRILLIMSPHWREVMLVAIFTVSINNSHSLLDVKYYVRFFVFLVNLRRRVILSNT